LCVKSGQLLSGSIGHYARKKLDLLTLHIEEDQVKEIKQMGKGKNDTVSRNEVNDETNDNDEEDT